MASWLKWTLGLAGLCLLIALGAQRITHDGFVRYEAQERLWAIQREVRATQRELMERAALDSARALLPDSPGAHIAPDLEASRIGGAVRAQLERTGGSAVRLAVLDVPAGLGVFGDASALARAVPVQYFAGRDEQGAYCAVVLRDPDEELIEELERRETITAEFDSAEEQAAEEAAGQPLAANPLGPCAFWVRYGEPGAGVREWLPRAGHLMSRPASVRNDSPPRRRRLFGARSPYSDLPQVHLAAQTCLSGRDDVCFDAILDSRNWGWWFEQEQSDGPALYSLSRYRQDSEAIVGSLFADLERELGHEDFARFWRSDEPAERVLGDALQADLSTWLMHWARARFGAEPRGPIVGAATWLLSLLSIGALVGAGVAVARRRRIGA